MTSSFLTCLTWCKVLVHRINRNFSFLILIIFMTIGCHCRLHRRIRCWILFVFVLSGLKILFKIISTLRALYHSSTKSEAEIFQNNSSDSLFFIQMELRICGKQGGSLMCVRTWCSDPSSSTFLTKMSTKSRDNKNRCLSLKQSLHILSTNWNTNAMLHYSTNVTWHWRD